MEKNKATCEAYCDVKVERTCEALLDTYSKSMDGHRRTTMQVIEKYKDVQDLLQAVYDQGRSA